jgi:hypothetical protein
MAIKRRNGGNREDPSWRTYMSPRRWSGLEILITYDRRVCFTLRLIYRVRGRTQVSLRWLVSVPQRPASPQHLPHFPFPVACALFFQQNCIPIATTSSLMPIICFDSRINFVLMHRAGCGCWMNDPRPNTGFQK